MAIEVNPVSIKSGKEERALCLQERRGGMEWGNKSEELMIKYTTNMPKN